MHQLLKIFMSREFGGRAREILNYIASLSIAQHRTDDSRTRWRFMMFLLAFISSSICIMRAPQQASVVRRIRLKLCARSSKCFYFYMWPWLEYVCHGFETMLRDVLGWNMMRCLGDGMAAIKAKSDSMIMRIMLRARHKSSLQAAKRSDDEPQLRVFVSHQKRFHLNSFSLKYFNSFLCCLFCGERDHCCRLFCRWCFSRWLRKH